MSHYSKNPYVKVKDIPFGESERGINHAQLERRLLAETYAAVPPKQTSAVISYDSQMMTSGSNVAILLTIGLIAAKAYSLLPTK